MKTIDRRTWPRRSHFELFGSYAMPYTSLVAPVEITSLVQTAKSQGRGLFKPLVWVASAAANAVPELRQRIRGEDVVEHEVVHPSYTTMSAPNVFNYATVDFDVDPERFFAAADRADASLKGETELVPDAPHRDDLLFLSSIPWRRITALTHPVPLDPPDSFVRIAWGRATPEANGKTEMSLGLMAHHGLVDGVHMARFYEAFEDSAAQLAKRLSEETSA